MRAMLFVFIAISSLLAFGEEQVTIIKLNDGRLLTVLSQTKTQIGNDEMVSVLTIDNEKVGFKKSEIATTTLRNLSELKLSDLQRATLEKEHNRIKDASALSKSIATAEKRVLELKRAEAAAVIEVRKTQAALTAFQTEQALLTAFVDDYPAALAKMDAAYEALKAEIASGSGYNGGGNNPQRTGSTRQSNANSLRKEMEDIAVKRVALTKQFEQAKSRLAELKPKLDIAAESAKAAATKSDESKAASSKAVLEAISLKNQ